MNSICLSRVTSTSASELGFCRPTTRSKSFFPSSRVSPSSISSRFRYEDEISMDGIIICERFQDVLKVHRRHTPSRIFASNPKLSGQEETDGAKSSDVAVGPPFLTILAGILVFFLILWIVGSVLLWLIGLIVKVPPLK